MGNCYCCSTVQYNDGDGKQDSTTTFNTTMKTKEPTYTSNQLYEIGDMSGKSRRKNNTRPLITEA